MAPHPGAVQAAGVCLSMVGIPPFVPYGWYGTPFIQVSLVAIAFLF